MKNQIHSSFYTIFIYTIPSSQSPVRVVLSSDDNCGVFKRGALFIHRSRIKCQPLVNRGHRYSQLYLCVSKGHRRGVHRRTPYWWWIFQVKGFKVTDAKKNCQGTVKDVIVRFTIQYSDENFSYEYAFKFCQNSETIFIRNI